jgi:hypothetical protein
MNSKKILRGLDSAISALSSARDMLRTAHEEGVRLLGRTEINLVKLGCRTVEDLDDFVTSVLRPRPRRRARRESR